MFLYLGMQTNNIKGKQMNLDLDKPTIIQLKTMVNAINNAFHNRKMENDFSLLSVSK